MGGLIAMPILAGPPQENAMPDHLRFLGQFHPLLLHLPIGVFTLILLQELGLIFFRKRGETRAPSLFPMFFGVATAALSVVAGFLLYQSGEFSGDLVERHMWGGLAFAVVACFTFIVQAWSIALAANLAFYRLLLFISVGVMGFASHDGGSLTHGSDYLLRYAPEPIRKFFNAKPRTPVPTAKPPQEQLVYADIIAPIFERRCVQCHEEGNSKGRLRMDTYELLLKGGKEGPAIEPGSAERSNIVVRMELPMDDEEHMPPDNKPQLEAHEILVIKWWLDSGADPAKALAEYEVPEEIAAAIAQIAPGAGSSDTAEAETEQAEESKNEDLANLVAELSKEFPGAVTFESRNSPLVTFTAVSMRGTLDDEMFGKIRPLVPQLVTLDLSATKITDAAVADLTGAANLRLIRLAETSVTDAAIETLITLPSLESINLYGTKVTDAGVLKLAALPNLKRLYLWQTEVSESAIAELREKLPECEIVTGV
jgi:uncharacterized membrane protein